nr:glycosyltransferase family 4 protein [Rhabdochromatium marinum]
MPLTGLSWLPALVLSAWLSAWLSTWLAGGAERQAPAMLRLLDHPNARSLHQQPIPRTGGVALVVGLGAGWLLWVLTEWLLMGAWPLAAGDGRRLTALMLAVLLVGGVSFLDDWRDLSPRDRLLAHLLAAAILIGAGMGWERLELPGLLWSWPPLLAWPLSVMLIVWMINLYNFMDGMDGLAASMAVFGFGALAGLGALHGAMLFAALNGLVVAAALGFLRVNFPPARLFMGDLGSSVLGVLAAGLSLWGAEQGLFPLWVAWLAFSPFILDATWTLLRRAFQGERVWEAHRSHHYQRLVLAGWSHRQTLVRASLVMAAAAVCAVAAPRLAPSDQWTLLLGWAGIYALIHWRVGLVERLAGQRNTGPQSIGSDRADGD